MPNIHPIFTHFPIALLTMSLIFDSLSIILKREQLERVGWWSQLSGTIGLAATVISGLAAKSHIIISQNGREAFEMHEEIAFFVAALAVTLLLWRIAAGMLLPKKKALYLSLLTATVILVWVGAWYGGELVYTFGTGVHHPAR